MDNYTRFKGKLVYSGLIWSSVRWNIFIIPIETLNAIKLGRNLLTYEIGGKKELGTMCDQLTTLLSAI